MTTNCVLYCLNFNNPKRNASMKERFEKVGIKPIFHSGVHVSDPRIAGRGLISHTEKCWSCMYGHLDMIRDFVENDSRPYGIFCEDDIMIDADFVPKLEHIVNDFETMGLDTLLLGYLITYPITGETNYGYPKLYQTIYVDIDSTETTTYRYYDYGDIWGTQMYMLSRKQATRILEKYLSETIDNKTYADRVLNSPFSADWTITKEGKRAIVYPMLAIEDGQTQYGDDECGQHTFHKLSHTSHLHISTYI